MSPSDREKNAWPPLEEELLFELIGMSDAEPVDDIDEVIYGPQRS